jgi:hypothetical protein
MLLSRNTLCPAYRTFEFQRLKHDDDEDNDDDDDDVIRGSDIY